MVLSIAAITLTQMVLNSQMHREEDTHRRDVALHAKLDELIRVTSEARDDLMQAEQKTEQEIEQLRG